MAAGDAALRYLRHEGFESGDIAFATSMFFVANALAITGGPAPSRVAPEWIEMRRVVLVAALMPLAPPAGSLLRADAPMRRRPAELS